MSPSSPEATLEERDFYSKYEAGEILGDGISSVVRRCIHKDTGEEFAVKIIDKLSSRGEDVKGIDIITQVRSEVNALSKLKEHPNIITLKDYYESSAFMFLVFELATGGELFDYLTKEVTIPEKIVRNFMFQLFQAVKYIHDHDIVHRDLKPENILLDENKNILLSDFGFAVDIKEDEKLFEVLGTPAYFAPETLYCVVYDSEEGYGKPVDLWACGVILYTLLIGQGPFWHRRDTIMYRKIMAGSYNFDSREWDDISEGPKDLIRKLLVVNPNERLTADEALSFPWFEGVEGFTKRAKKQRLKFKTLVYTIVTMKKLYYTFHERYVPMTYKAVLTEPYAFRDMRKMVDSCAFTMYGHWVKRTPDQVQNRNALFANEPKRDMLDNTDIIDGVSRNIPTMYSYRLTHSFIPKRPSFEAIRQKNSSSKMSEQAA